MPTVSYVEQARAALLTALATTAQEFADDRLLDLYTLLVLTVGGACSRADVHDAWAVARTRTRPEHADLVPFPRLTDEVRAYDTPFRDAIRAAAATLAGAP